MLLTDYLLLTTCKLHTELHTKLHTKVHTKLLLTTSKWPPGEEEGHAHTRRHEEVERRPLRHAAHEGVVVDGEHEQRGDVGQEAAVDDLRQVVRDAGMERDTKELSSHITLPPLPPPPSPAPPPSHLCELDDRDRRQPQQRRQGPEGKERHVEASLVSRV